MPGKIRVQFTPTVVNGVVLMEAEAFRDERGAFRRLWCMREASEAGLPAQIVQSSLSETRDRATLRGLHFQLPPSREAKVVCCVRGRIFDVALDLRTNSQSYLGWFGTELAGGEPKALFIPPGCAHGFLTLVQDCLVLYMMTDFYAPGLAAGVRWNDPAFGIEWPEQPKQILPRDAEYPDFDPEAVRGFADY